MSSSAGRSDRDEDAAARTFAERCHPPEPETAARDLVAVIEAAQAFVGTTTYYRQRNESRPEFERLAFALLRLSRGARRSRRRMGGRRMTWWQQTIARLVLFVAALVARAEGQEEIAAEIKALSNHITTYRKPVET